MRIFVGYDPRQPVAFNILAHSVFSRATKPVSITRLQLAQLPIKRRGLTEFTYSRFLVPYLSNYEDYSIFLDSDMLCRGDIIDLLPQAYLEKVTSEQESELWVVKNPQRQFEWASMMVFNNARCKILTPEYIDDASHPLYPMEWATRVGELQKDWNHLVGYDTPNNQAKIIHFTQGIPCWPETKNCEFAKEWQEEAKAAMGSVSFNALMGNSVHAKYVKGAAH